MGWGENITQRSREDSLFKHLTCAIWCTQTSPNGEEEENGVDIDTKVQLDEVGGVVVSTGGLGFHSGAKLKQSLPHHNNIDIMVCRNIIGGTWGDKVLGDEIVCVM